MINNNNNHNYSSVRVVFKSVKKKKKKGFLSFVVQIRLFCIIERQKKTRNKKEDRVENMPDHAVYHQLLGRGWKKAVFPL